MSTVENVCSAIPRDGLLKTYVASSKAVLYTASITDKLLDALQPIVPKVLLAANNFSLQKIYLVIAEHRRRTKVAHRPAQM